MRPVPKILLGCFDGFYAMGHGESMLRPMASIQAGTVRDEDWRP